MIEKTVVPPLTARRVQTAVAWSLVPLLSVGLLSWLPFGWFALRRRSVPLAGCALGYLAAVAAFAGFAPEEAGDGFWALVVLATWWGAAVHVLCVVLLERRAPTVEDGNRRALRAALAVEARRKEARALVTGNPGAARELRIGRPDLPRSYDDGGLVDLNAVPAHVLAEALGWSSAEAEDVVEVRGRLGRFDGPAELIAYTGLLPGRVDAAAPLLVFSA